MDVILKLMKTKIVLVVTDKEKNAVIKAAAPDMIELRVDLLVATMRHI